ncbi:MAG: PPK2 family polyphosphate kinase [Ktedonobacteraceae bacterium]
MYIWRVNAGDSVRLDDFDPGYTGEQIDKQSAHEELKKLRKELSTLQEMLWAAHHQSVLLVLQGTDTSGKDGTIRHVLAHLNPQGCRVHSFTQPTQQELDHDFLWRVHQATPGKGSLDVFNRSHYEDVLVIRVNKLVPEKVWQNRYEAINNFEKLLTDNNTIILKFFLHISYEEQKQRLLARENDHEKAWKLSASDWKGRHSWPDYQQAYEDMLMRCSKPQAPWYIVPANHKWFRNLAIAHTLLETLRPYKQIWEQELRTRGQQELECLKKTPHV